MKKLTVDGITFETTKEAKAAERELEAIEKIRGRMDVTNPIYAKVLYEKLIEKEMLHTKVGDKFLAELQSYFDPEAAAKDAAEISSEMSAEPSEEVPAETSGEVSAEASKEVSAETSKEVSAEAAAQEKAETAVPYLDEAAQEDSGRAAEDGSRGAGTAFGEQTPGDHADVSDIPEEIVFGADFDEAQEAGSGKDGAEHSGVSSDTGKLESILHRAIFDEKDLIPFEEKTDGSSEAGTDAVSEEDLPDEYFGATGLDALVEEYDEADANGSKNDAAHQMRPEEEKAETSEDDEADLDAFMKEYGLTDIAAEETGDEQTKQSAEENEDTDETDLDALMEEYGVTNIAEPKTGEAEEQPEDENDEISAEELNTLVDEYTETGVGKAGAESTVESPLGLNIEENEESGRQEESAFHLELDDADLYDEEPDNDTLLAEAVTLKKELHREDLSEIFSERDEQPEKKRFSLYGVLIVSLILNVVLIASMVIMVQVFNDSDNRNILNYERILEQEYQTATPSDAE